MDDTDRDSRTLSGPPARIAKRLQRRSNSRRRSSAHSSRRSSISSLNSRVSSLSCHGGPYSTHIAQHLRRASIIENRKARLAERAAHAEQVRLRAAAAKAAPRISNSEEKALAAQAAREKLLAEITARCAEEVRRAKEVAEETREKKAAEHARLEAQIAEKFADAARRKSNYQMNTRRPRTASLAAVEEKKIEPTELKKIGRTAAVKVIQRSWRKSYGRRLACSFRDAGIGVDLLASKDFEHVTKLISGELTMTVALRMMQFLGLQDNETDETAKRGAARVFLSAFMVVAHPVPTFSHGGKEPQEQDLIRRAQAMTSAIQTCIDALTCDQKLHLAKGHLQALFLNFTSGFHAWKTQDLGILADVWVASFVNFDLIIQATKDSNDGHVAEDYLNAIKTEQTKILVHLKRLLGPDKALDRVRRAVRRARRDRAARKTKGPAENVPRASTPIDMDIDAVPTNFLTPPATPREAQQSETASSFLKKLELSMTVLPSNREIAHEIQVSGNFEIHEHPWTDARDTFMTALKRDMRSSLQHGGTEAEADWTHAMVILIKNKLLQVVTPKHNLYERINTFLDARLLAQQVQKGMFVYNEFFLTLANIIKHLCSPGRDELVRQFSEDTESDTVERLFRLIHIIDLMILDYLNFQFRIAASAVRHKGHEHEHLIFEKDLNENRHSLDKTRAFWSRGRAAVISNTPQPNPNAVYARALTDLVLSNAPIDHNKLPETLFFDWLRLLDLRARAFHIVAIASVLLTSKLRLRRNREALWAREAEQLMRIDIHATDAASIVRQIESGHMMPDTTRAGLMDFVSRVLPTAVLAATQLQAAKQEHYQMMRERRGFNQNKARDPADQDVYFREQVAAYILKSLREHIYIRLSASSTAEKIRATSGAAATLARIGMPEFLGEVAGMVDVLERVKNVDLKSHEKWYDLIANEART